MTQAKLNRFGEGLGLTLVGLNLFDVKLGRQTVLSTVTEKRKG